MKNNGVFVYHDKFQELSDKGIDLFIKSLKYPPDSLEQQICRLKGEIYKRESLKYLKLFLAGIENGRN